MRAFAVWLYWSIIIVQMQNLHVLGLLPLRNDGVPTSYRALLYTLPAIAGLAGATLRIPNSFMIAISGGRNVIFVTTLLLIADRRWASALRCRTPRHTWVLTFAMLASAFGCRGRRLRVVDVQHQLLLPQDGCRGLSLGLNAGLGNVGVSVMQVLLPFVMTFGAVRRSGRRQPDGAGGAGRRRMCGSRTADWSGFRSWWCWHGVWPSSS